MLNSIVYVKVDAGCDMIGTNLQIHAPKLMRLFMANLYLQNYFRGGKGLYSFLKEMIFDVALFW